jgi:Alpha-L-arabinofuranosidase B, catalytic
MLTRLRVFIGLLFLALCLASFSSEAQLAGFFIGNNGGCSSSPLPFNSDTLAAAYSFRKVVRGYTGYAVRLERASDDTTLDVGFASNGCDFNSTAATTFCTSTTCSVDIWYDQSGNGANVSESTLADQPIVTLSCQNSRPCMATSTTQYLTGTLAASITNDTFVMVGKYGGTPSSVLVSINNSYSSLGVVTTTGSGDFFAQGGGTSGPFAFSAGGDRTTFHSFIGIQNATLARIYTDGVLGTDSTTSKSISSANDIWVGRNSSDSNQCTCSISEVILFAPDISSTDANTVSTNQQTYWGT